MYVSSPRVWSRAATDESDGGGLCGDPSVMSTFTRALIDSSAHHSLTHARAIQPENNQQGIGDNVKTTMWADIHTMTTMISLRILTANRVADECYARTVGMSCERLLHGRIDFLEIEWQRIAWSEQGTYKMTWGHKLIQRFENKIFFQNVTYFNVPAM